VGEPQCIGVTKRADTDQDGLGWSGGSVVTAALGWEGKLRVQQDTEG
jgi:hypothetical protein